MSGPFEPPQDPNAPAQNWPPPPQPVVVGPSRLSMRPMPTAGSTLAGAGIALAVIGVIVWAGSYAVSGITSSFDGGGGGGSTRNWLGIVLALAVTAGGFIAAAVARQGAMATVGVAATAAGVPTTIGFITLDVTGGSPINIDALFLVTIVVWMVSYLIVPGTRGHSFYLGLSAIALWLYIVIKISPAVFGLPFLSAARAITGADISSQSAHLGTLAAVSFIMGGLYYVVAYMFDREGHHGIATPLMVAGFPVTVSAFFFVSDDFGAAGTGVLLVIVSAILIYIGARGRRRFTTWAWGAGLAEGVGLIISKISPHNVTAAGVLLILVGLGIALLGVALASALGEREYPSG